ncbi:hypothetical protein IWW45_000887 [Coemansia sp. RSA 485]|nr:hypothetical protein IWW45_000887 [Coemansia sp. RSA 485]KAJ2600925.1 hypothetical protein GGF39_001514 [Coemansia sp. RSA 1721]
MGLFTSCFGEPDSVHSRHRRRVVTKTMIGMPSNFVTEKIKALMTQVSAALDDTDALDIPKDPRRRAPAPPPMRMGMGVGVTC